MELNKNRNEKERERERERERGGLLNLNKIPHLN